MLYSDVIESVLLTGPQHRNHRGGIGGVLATYVKHQPNFRFLPTYRPFPWKVLLLPYFAFSYLRFISLLLWNPRIRIVHMQGASEGSVYRDFVLFFTAKYVFRRSVIFHLHSGTFLPYYDRSPRFVKSWMRQLAEDTDAFVCLSEGWRRIYSERFPKANLFVLPNPVEPRAGAEIQTGPHTLSSDGTIRMLYLGVITEPKGIFDLVHTMHRFQKKWAGRVHLTIGGDGELARMRALLREFNLEDCVHCAGWVTGATKEELLRQADVFVLPSYTEGLPLSILEAMSQGLPILSTRVGGVPELVEDGENGYLVAPGDVEALADRIERWLNDPAKMRSMGRSSAERARSYYPDSVFGRLYNLYTSLLSRAAAPVSRMVHATWLAGTNDPHQIFEKYPYLC